MDLVASFGVMRRTIRLRGVVMKAVKHNRKIWLILASLFLLAALPAATFGQGRGRGRGQEKKLDTFVNGHDARDGRFDGRGPQIGQRTILVAPRNRGRGIGLERRRRFINGHDARNGRFDGRGPRLGLRRHHRRLDQGRFLGR
jgi:hypothetical protein